MRLAENRSRLAASCWSVEVVNGGGGFFRLFRRLTSSARKGRPATSVTTAAASDSDPSRNFFPPIDWSFAAKPWPAFSRWAVMDQYSSCRKAERSSSRSQTSRSATVCTRPADSPGRIGFQSRCETW